MKYNNHKLPSGRVSLLNSKILVLGTLSILVVLLLLMWVNRSDPPIQAQHISTAIYKDLPRLGQVDAPVQIIEFADFKCPACRYFSQNIFPQLKEDYIDTGLVSFYYMHNTVIAQDSVKASLASIAVHHAGEDFWSYYDLLYKRQQAPDVEWATPEYLTELAKEAGINIDETLFKNDIENNTYARELNSQLEFAKELGVKSVPALIINGVRYENDNVLDYKKLKKNIDNAIQNGSTEP